MCSFRGPATPVADATGLQGLDDEPTETSIKRFTKAAWNLVSG